MAQSHLGASRVAASENLHDNSNDDSSEENSAAHQEYDGGLQQVTPVQSGEKRHGPLISSPIPSKRSALEQPNTRPDPAEPNLKFWLALILVGIATGLFGDLMMVVLFGVQHIAYNYHSGSYQTAVEHVSGAHRVASLMIAGAFGGIAWYLLRKYTKGESTEADNILWLGKGKLSFRRSFLTSIISEIVIGMGASIGREAAPKLMGAVSGDYVARWTKMTPHQRRLLIACGAGAGLAAVYNVPLGGALFAAELLYGSLSISVVLPALATSLIATVTSWVYLPNHVTYLGLGNFHFTTSQLIWAIVVGPIFGVLSVGYVRMMAWVSHYRMSGKKIIAAPFVAFTILGVVGIRYPELFGNGKDMAHSVFLDGGSLTLLLALFALKPLVTALCVGSGASGGLFTPTLSTGAVLGGALGLLWSMFWPGASVGSYAFIGAAAIMGSGMQAPLAAIVLMLELTHTGLGIVVPLIVATVLATLVARTIDGYSIYSARLPEIEY